VEELGEGQAETLTFLVQRRQSTSQSITGELLVSAAHYCFTLEPPYGPSTVKPRAVPAGTFPLDIRFSPRFDRMMPHIENIPDFTDVMLHWGNFPWNTDACILVGSTLGPNFVGNSVAEFDNLFVTIGNALEQGPQVITIADPTGGAAVDVDSEIAT
jgi:hypothetical protein